MRVDARSQAPAWERNCPDFVTGSKPELAESGFQSGSLGTSKQARQSELIGRKLGWGMTV